jgi:hypothetical protein
MKANERSSGERSQAARGYGSPGSAWSTRRVFGIAYIPPQTTGLTLREGPIGHVRAGVPRAS